MKRVDVPPPRLVHALRLRCPHCGVTPLRTAGSWFTFRDECPRCAYRILRETGYFTGAAWVMTYTAASLAGIATGAALLWQKPEVDSLVLAAMASVVAAVTAFLFMPFGKALWIWLDHVLHPLEERDRC